MKLMIITPSFTGGGAEKIAVNLANQYAKDGLDVVVLAFRAEGPYLDQLDSNVKLIDLKVKRIKYALFPLVRSLKAENPTYILSVIRGSNVFVGLASFFYKKCKIIYREANTMDGIYLLPRLKRWQWKFLIKLSYQRADIVIANSSDTKRDLIDNRLVKKERVVVVGNPVLPSNYEKKCKEYISHRWISDPRLKVMLSVGRLHRQKNHKLLLEAFAKVSRDVNDVRLIVLGSGEEEKALKSLASDLEVSDIFEIVPFTENPYPYYKRADLFVLTSDWEGFGNVLVEALACGTPVVSTNCPGGPKEILEDGKYGLLVEKGDVAALVNAIESVLDGSKVFDKDELINRANSYKVDEVSKRYLEVML